jgi:HEAT repeats
MNHQELPQMDASAGDSAPHASLAAAHASADGVARHGKQATRRAARWLMVATVIGLFAVGHRAESADDPARGTKAVYGPIPQDQVENLSTGDQIIKIARGGAPTAIWETLEHGERVECLNCIVEVEPLLYDANAKTREIAAWWLRRRTFGVFGSGEVYERTLNTLKDRSQSANRRAHAASALGEFLVGAGAEVLASALAGATPDPDIEVRRAAALALGRMNNDGAGALGAALSDAAPAVKLAAMYSVSLINTPVDGKDVAPLLADADPLVRRRAAEVLGTLQAVVAVDALIARVRSDADADVRLAACHTLGQLRDGRARGALEQAAAGDSNGLVRDQAKIALRRL